MNFITKITFVLTCLSLQRWAIDTFGKTDDSSVTQHSVNFSDSKNGFLYTSLTESDRGDFENLRAVHNAQPLDRVPYVGDVFQNQIDRYESGNAWHILMVCDASKVNDEKPKPQAALIFGRQNSIGYETGKHNKIQKLMHTYGITDENNTRIENHGLATYVLMTDMTKNAAHLAEWHKVAVEHCKELVAANCELPVEKTQATHVMLLTRGHPFDKNAMEQTGYKLYKDENGNSNLAEFFPPKITYAWVQALQK
ncbi:MAG: hypothetical protein Q8S21_06375 [Candidatus Paracaedibacteraceae bacterium]|nr:hypothetical protein [Candidatus Paracaedibacteraceae bacterium]